MLRMLDQLLIDGRLGLRFAAAIVLMALVALIASAVPPVNASGIHPARVLHAE
jgi:hypothetical protein